MGESQPAAGASLHSDVHQAVQQLAVDAITSSEETAAAAQRSADRKRSFHAMSAGDAEVEQWTAVAQDGSLPDLQEYQELSMEAFMQTYGLSGHT